VRLVCASYRNDDREKQTGMRRALGQEIVIEDHSYIGSHVTILPGVRVGYASTVAEGSLVYKVSLPVVERVAADTLWDVLHYSVVGSPA
jgi:acetyltransferase-like isoleucine patch superfamily enzyme